MTPVLTGAIAVVCVIGTVVLAVRQPGTLVAAGVLCAGGVAVAAILLAPRVHPALPITAGLVLSVFSGNWGLLGVPVGLDRPLILYGLLTAALRLLPDARERWTVRWLPLHLLLLAVAAYAIGSAMLAGTFGVAEPTFALSERLGVACFALFTVSSAVFATQRSRDWLLVGLLVLGVYLSATAVLEGLGLDGLVLPRYIVDPTVGLTPERARGPFIESGSFGLALIASLVVACIAAVRWRRRLVRVLCAAVVLACALGIVFTLTRQVWLGAAFGLAAAMVASPRLRRWVLPAGVAAAVVVAAAFVVVPGLQDRASDRGRTRLSVYDRLNSNAAALRMFEDEPVLGHGWYSFARVSLDYLEQAPDYPLRSVEIPHNVFLQFFAELGILGGGGWLLALVIIMASAIAGRAPPELEPWRVGLVAIAGSWLVVANLAPIGGSFTNYTLWLWPGVVFSGLVRHPLLERWAAVRPARAGMLVLHSTARRVAIVVACAAVAGVVGYVVGRGRPVTYRAQRLLAVGTLAERGPAFAYYDIGLARLASTYSRLALGDRVLGAAAASSGTSAEALRAGSVVTPLLREPVVLVRGTASSAEAARGRVQALSGALESTVNRYNAQEPALRRLRRDYRTASLAADEALDDVLRAIREVTADGADRRDLPLRRQRPVLRADAVFATALERKSVAGVSYTSLASGGRSIMDLHALGPAVVVGDSRGTSAQQWAAGGGVAGLLVGALLSVVWRPRRRRG